MYPVRLLETASQPHQAALSLACFGDYRGASHPSNSLLLQYAPMTNLKSIVHLELLSADEYTSSPSFGRGAYCSSFF
eukprot:4082223-Pleurochrysis_carterae.AAC.1